MKKIYGNEQLLLTLGRMTEMGCTAHSIIFYGEKGCGRKLIADYHTAQLLCESLKVGGIPCGECKACKTIKSCSNPDVIYVPTDGKSEGYSVKITRSIINNAYLKPNNNSGKKVYLFRNCKNMSAMTQNMLLKIIEDPPDYAFFFFTAESRHEFLPTILSRCICFAVNTCTDEDTKKSLYELKFTNDDIKSAINCFHGNIGMCTKYIVDKVLREQVDLTKKIADSIIRKDEYGLNVAFYSVGKKRNKINEVLTMIDKFIRDAALLLFDANAMPIGVYHKGSMKLAGILTAYRAVKMHEVLEKAKNEINANVNPFLVFADLCGDIIEILN